MYYYSPLYIILTIPVLLASLGASLLFRYWNNKYQNTPNTTNLTGLDTVQKLGTKYAHPISIKLLHSDNGDHFNPISDELALSRGVANRPSIASVAIAAHEYGHTRQKFEGAILMNIRRILVPTVNIGTNAGYVLIILGLLLLPIEFAWIGLGLFSISTIFALLTVPIELDASAKAIQMIRENQLLDSQEITDAKKILFGASLTYVAALFSSLMNLVYFAIRIQGSNRD